MVGPNGDVSSVFSPASTEAHAIAELFQVTLIVCGGIFLIVAALVGYSLVRFRGREGDAEPPQVEGNSRLELAWTGAPVVVLAVILTLTVRTMGAVDPPATGTPDVIVVGHQWWWEVRYPATGAITANEIHVPVGRKLLVGVESADVIHDFWVPELARKVDAVPGQPNHVWMEVTAPGTYLGACAEYCGSQHAWMRLRVVAEPAAEYDAWLSRETAPAAAPHDAAAGRGAAIFREKTCANCHGISSQDPGSPPARVAPDLTHLASRATLGAGVIENSPATLARWLADPDAIKPGSHMPNFHLSAAEVSDLVAYFETLR